MKCPACKGECWVDSKHTGPSVCPVCKGIGKINDPITPNYGKEKKYDQSSIWIELTNSTPLTFDEALRDAVQVLDNPAIKAMTVPVSMVIHLLFDRSITPQGNLLFDQVRRGQLRTGQKAKKLSEDHLRARGYSINPDGTVQTIDDVPVSPFYNTLVEWGVNNYSAHRMTKPITIDVNRKGNPFFMDDFMAAVGATYSDLDWVKPSIELLNIYCTEGVKGNAEIKPVGRIVNLSLFCLTSGI